MFIVAKVHVLETVQMNVVAMGNVKRGNVSAIRDLWVQTAVSVPKELNVIKVSESGGIRESYLSGKMFTNISYLL